VGVAEHGWKWKRRWEEDQLYQCGYMGFNSKFSFWVYDKILSSHYSNRASHNDIDSYIINIFNIELNFQALFTLSSKVFHGLLFNAT